MKHIDDIVNAIARQHLGIATLETRNCDSLDFHDLSVWAVKDALRAAYRAGSAPDTPIVTITVRGGLIDDMGATAPVHVVVEDWDITDDDTGRKPARNAWKLNATLTGPKAKKLRHLIAND